MPTHNGTTFFFLGTTRRYCRVKVWEIESFRAWMREEPARCKVLKTLLHKKMLFEAQVFEHAALDPGLVFNLHVSSDTHSAWRDL